MGCSSSKPSKPAKSKESRRGARATGLPKKSPPVSESSSKATDSATRLAGSLSLVIPALAHPGSLPGHHDAPPTTARPNPIDDSAASARTITNQRQRNALLADEDDARTAYVHECLVLLDSMHNEYLTALRRLTVNPFVDFAGDDDDVEDDDSQRKCSMTRAKEGMAKAVGESKPMEHVVREQELASRAVMPFSVDDVRRHCSEDDCWIILRGKIYNVTNLLAAHPGGLFAIFQHRGGDATHAFESSHDPAPYHKMREYFVADLLRTT